MKKYDCAVCGKSCVTHDKRPNRGKYCSQSCYWKDKRKKLRGIQFAVPPLSTQTVRVPNSPYMIGYLAGLIDGEGSVSLKKNSSAQDGIQPYIAVFNTYKPVIDWLKETFGGRVHLFGKNRPSNWKPEWAWEVRSYRDIKAILDAVIPFLKIKRANAEKVLPFTNQRITQWEKRHEESKAQRNAPKFMIPESMITEAYRKWKEGEEL